VEDSPLRPEEGKPLTFPFSVSDADGDAVTVLYRIGDDVTWSVLPTSSDVNVLPADLVSELVSKPEVQKIEVTAFDGLDVSDEPVAFLIKDTGLPEWEPVADPIALSRYKLIEQQHVTIGDLGCDIWWAQNHPLWYFLPHGGLGDYRVTYRIDESGSKTFTPAGDGKAFTLRLRPRTISEIGRGRHNITFGFFIMQTFKVFRSNPYTFVVDKVFEKNTI
jgi:hypothetical protein